MMSMISKLKRFYQPQTIMAALALAAALACLYFFLQQSNTNKELSDVTRQVTASQRKLDLLAESRLNKEATLKELQDEFERKKGEASQPSDIGLVSRREALELMPRLSEYVAHNQVALGDFTYTEGDVKILNSTLPAISYVMAAKGPADALINMLDVVWEVPTASIQSLELIRDLDHPGTWIMSLDIAVFYQPQL